MEDLKNILKELKELNKDIGASGDLLLDCATRIFISNNIQAEKYGWKQEDKIEIPKPIDNTIYQSPKQPSPATDKQKQMLKRLNIKFDETITKGEAYQLIKEVKG